MRDNVDVRSGVIRLRKLGSLGQERDSAAIRRDVVVARVAERLHGGLRAGDRGVDANEEVLEVASKLEIVAIASGQNTREDGESLRRDVGVPVADEVGIIDVTAALGQLRELLVVRRAIGVRVCVDKEVDVSRLGLHRLEARERRIQRRN